MSIQYATFRLGDLQFAIDILSIKEFYRKIDYNVVNRSPDFVRGLLNLRGQIITLVDLKKMFFNETQEFTKTTRCVIMKSAADMRRLEYVPELELENDADRLGILVEEIGEMISVDDKELKAPPANLTIVNNEFVKKVFKTEDELYLILNFKAIFADYLAVPLN
jgi:purine-binding chemotaxis protein CheW